MIRRDEQPRSAPTHWILITQLEHARLAGVLAEHWGGGDFLPLADSDAVLWGATHHDDGWQPWEIHPDVNPAGQPRAFTEMEPADSLAIWSRSIEIARDVGPLECSIVAGHFYALARRATVFLRQPDQLQFVERFVARNDDLIVEQLTAWQALDPARNTASRAELALLQLQMFDALSLWFCCTPTGESETLITPGGKEMSLIMLGENVVRFTPWPFRSAGLNLEIHGRRVPVRTYANAAELAAVAAQPVLLRWQLQSGHAES